MEHWFTILAFVFIKQLTSKVHRAKSEAAGEYDKTFNLSVGAGHILVNIRYIQQSRFPLDDEWEYFEFDKDHSGEMI